ncbi:hypothetical protein HOC01_04820 [archaeon]|jgi:hypothetical protein|nr:hypothetical protein [archaeon]MBT6698290.1 hypothetical protein [archaeon]
MEEYSSPGNHYKDNKRQGNITKYDPTSLEAVGPIFGQKVKHHKGILNQADRYRHNKRTKKGRWDNEREHRQDLLDRNWR